MSLPNGSWFTLNGLRHATADALQARLADCGINLPLENISVAQTGHAAIISLSKQHMRSLVARALIDETGRPVELNGRSLIPSIPENAR